MSSALRWSRAATSTVIGRRRLVAALALTGALSIAGCTSSDEGAIDDPVDGTPSDGAGDDLDSTDDELGYTDEPAEEPGLEPLTLDDIELPSLATPEEALAELEGEIANAVTEAAASDTVAILEAADLDEQATAEEIESFGDGLPRTASGRLIVLDEAASLACATAEQALWAVDEADVAGATDQTRAASAWAADSEVEGFDSWSQSLGEQADSGSIDPVVIVGFLSTCVDGGHEL